MASGEMPVTIETTVDSNDVHGDIVGLEDIGVASNSSSGKCSDCFCFPKIDRKTISNCLLCNS